MIFASFFWLLFGQFGKTRCSHDSYFSKAFPRHFTITQYSTLTVQRIKILSITPTTSLKKKRFNCMSHSYKSKDFEIRGSSDAYVKKVV